MELVNGVVVGDGAVGKTSMLITYVQNQFPSEYITTVVDTYSCNISLNGRIINLSEYLCNHSSRESWTFYMLQDCMHGIFEIIR